MVLTTAIVFAVAAGNAATVDASINAPGVTVPKAPAWQEESAYHDEAMLPPLDEIKSAAAAFSGFDVSRASSWRKKAAKSAWAPQLSARAKYENFTHGSEKYGADSPYAIMLIGAGWMFEVGATWDLDETVFNKDELDAAREGAAVFNEYRRLMDEVTAVYLELMDLIAAKRGPGQDSEKSAILKKIRFSVSRLDTMTGGRFTQMCSTREAGVPQLEKGVRR